MTGAQAEGIFFCSEGLTEERKMEKVEATKEKLEDLHYISRTEILYHAYIYQGPKQLGTCKPTAMWPADACPLACPQNDLN